MYFGSLDDRVIAINNELREERDKLNEQLLTCMLSEIEVIRAKIMLLNAIVERLTNALYN